MGEQPSSVDPRYLRQTILSEIGEAGQLRLAEASVLVLGCGALGSVSAQVLVRAGIGRTRIVDPDPPELGNLHRQVLFDESDLEDGRTKAELAAEKLRRFNSTVTVEGSGIRATAANIDQLLEGVDLVVDACDSFETRLLVNDVCLKTRTPWIYGGVVGTVGMSMNIIPGQGPCFRCFVTEAPPEGALPTTETHGVLSTAPMAIALIQATEGIKILLGGSTVRRGLTVVDLWSNRHSEYAIPRLESCPACGKRRFEYLESGGRGAR